MPRGKESPTATRKEEMPREKRREITREASIYVVANRIRRGEIETMENHDMVRKRHGSSVCTKRGQAASAVEGGSKTTKANTRRTVEKLNNTGTSSTSRCP